MFGNSKEEQSSFFRLVDMSIVIDGDYDIDTVGLSVS